MDREFYNAEVIRYLQFRHLRAAIPVRAGWKIAAEGEKGRRSFTTFHTITSDGEEVRVRVHGVKRCTEVRRGEHKIESPFLGVIGPRPPFERLRALYRGRLGIEST